MELFRNEPFEILGLPRGASKRQIKKTFRRLAMKFHPDRNPAESEAEEKFKQIQWAYEVLMSGKEYKGVASATGTVKYGATPGVDPTHPFYRFFTAMKAYFARKTENAETCRLGRSENGVSDQ